MKKINNNIHLVWLIDEYVNNILKFIKLIIFITEKYEDDKIIKYKTKILISIRESI